MVGQVECVSHQFHGVPLMDFDGLGEAQVLHVGAGEAERISSNGIDAERATGTIYATAARYAARSITAGCKGEGQASLELEDRGQSPVIGDIAEPSTLFPG